MNYGKNSEFKGRTSFIKAPRLSASELTRGALVAAVAFVLGACRLPFSVYPLGFAFVCAAAEMTLTALIGLLASSLLIPLNKTVFLLSAILTVVLRVLTRLFIDKEEGTKSLADRLCGNLFCEALSLRAACAALSAFTLSLYHIVIGGFKYYDLFGAILSISVASIATPIFYGAFGEGKKEWRFSALHSKLARISVSALLCLSLGAFDVSGFRPALILAFMLTVNFCTTDGLGEACVCAFLCGAACGVAHIPTLVVAALTAYCVLDVSPSLAAAVACIAGSICGVMISGSSYMTSPFLSLLLGCTLFSVFKKLIAEQGSSYKASAQVSRGDYAICESPKELVEKARGAFCSLSSELPDLVYADEILSSLTADGEEDTEQNERISKAIRRRLYELGFGKVNASVYGKRNFVLAREGERLAGKADRAEFIKRQAEAAIGFPLVISKLQNGGRTIILRRDSIISYHHAISICAKEEVCGDSADLFFDKERNYLYAVICDGMGSGKEANEVSARALSILKRLLLAGLAPRRALTALSSILQGGGADEITTTADLLRLDLYTGEGLIVKSGAAPSYIKRGEKLTRLSARTVPMGIFESADLCELEFSVKENDLLIMASDGVAESESDGIHIESYLNAHKPSLPKEIARDITDACRQNGKTDDLSVIAIKIFPQNY